MAYSVVLLLAFTLVGASVIPESRPKRDLISDAINGQLLAKSSELQKEAGSIYDASIAKINEAVTSSNDPNKVKQLNEYLNKFNTARQEVVVEMTQPGNWMNGGKQLAISAKYLGTIKNLASQLEEFLGTKTRSKRDLISDAINSQLLGKSSELQKEAGSIYDASIAKINEAVTSSNDPNKVKQLNEYLNKFNTARQEVVVEMTQPGNWMNGAKQLAISAKYLGTIKNLASQLDEFLGTRSRSKRDLISDAINSQLLGKSSELQKEAGAIYDASIAKINEAVTSSNDPNKVKQLNEYLNKFNTARQVVVVEMTQPGNWMNGAKQLAISAKYLGTIKNLASQLDEFIGAIRF